MPHPLVSVAPVRVPAPGRPAGLDVRVTAPVAGDRLPVVVLSHGAGPSRRIPSLDGYAPLAQAWAAAGLVVVQPTHLSSPTVHLEQDEPDAPMHWRSRAADVSRVVDHLDLVVDAVPGLAGRVAADRVAVAGHSMGGHTVQVLLGAQVTDPADGERVDLADRRLLGGVLLAAPGHGDGLTDEMRSRFGFLGTTDLTTLSAPALVVVGADDASAHLTAQGPRWFRGPFEHAPGARTLVTVTGGEHGLGGLAGWDAAETTDEDPDRVALVAGLTAAWLRSLLVPGDDAWPRARAMLLASEHPGATLEER